jgi:4-hydroxybenzoate polyprenyltransferase
METRNNPRIVDIVPVCKEPPLCVDLDDTLVKTDTLLECLLLLLKKNFFNGFLLPFWLLKGKAYFKQQVARRVNLNAALLPYHTELLAYLAKQHQCGRTLILTTAAEESIAHRIAEHVRFFSHVLATNGTHNLAGAGKLVKIQDHLDSSPFVYVGNAKVDLGIWRSSQSAIVVNAPDHLVRRVRNVTNIDHIFNERKNPIRAYIKAIRAHQWIKNGLIFVPLLAAHHFTDVNRLLAALVAFAAFSFCSSSIYVVNDLLDLEADRCHPSNKNRPFASGELAVKVGLITIPVFLLAGLALSLLLPFLFTITLGIYFFLTVAYSFYIKRFMIVDVILLALLYTVRIIGGGVASGIVISNWLLAFSMFFFLSLALLKRYTELHHVARTAKQADNSRGYTTADIEQLASMGSASGYLTALVLGLYINSEDVKALYAYPEFLWLICPLILYWISRAWLIARRGHMDDDPVLFAIRDMGSYVVGIASGIIMMFAIG